MLARSLVAALLLLASPLAHAEVTVVVIVNVANPVTALDREALSKLYLKKETRWTNGKEVMVIEPASRDAQEAFAKQVHPKSWKEVRHHYQQLVFATRGAAPIEMKDDAAVADCCRSSWLMELRPGWMVSTTAVSGARARS